MYHRQSIELWFDKELFTIRLHGDYRPEVYPYVFASATLVDFPQFRDIHHLIPLVLEINLLDLAQLDYHQIEDSDKWEIYVKYRQIVSGFLIGRCAIPQEVYVNLAEDLLHFLSKGLE